MPTPIAMPRLGMTMTEGRIVAWPVSLGASVARGDVVLVIETDKAEIDVEATGSGTLAHIYVEPGATVDCGTLLAALVGPEDADLDPQAYLDQYNRQQAQSGPSPGVSTRRESQGKSEAKKPGTAQRETATRRAPGAGTPVTPAARKLAKEHGIDAALVSGSGPGGRVTREDIESLIARRRDRVAVAEDVALEVAKQGAGDRVLLLPGFGSDVSAFSAQIPSLTESFEVWGVNPRGVGESDAPGDGPLSVATLASDAAALIDAPAHIVGTSLGTAVAIELALSQPEKVRSLTLLAPLLRVASRLEAVSQAWCELAVQTTPGVLATALLPWFFGSATLADARRRERMARGLATTLAQVNAESLVRSRAGMLAWSGTRESELGKIGVPTLVVTAGDDLLTPAGEKVAESIPRARLERIDGAGHAVGLEAPQEINRAILAHLSAASSTSD